MQKKCVVALMPVFMCLAGYSQQDSVPFHSSDTTIQLITPESTEKKVINNLPSSTNEPVYTLHPGIDIPIVAVGTIWSCYVFTKIYNKARPSVEQIQNLKISNINAFDRWAIYPYSKSLDDISYYPFYAAMPLPLIFFLTEKETRSEFGKLTFLYWETMAITGLTGTSAPYFVNRYRPYAYSQETPMDKRTGHVVKNSFYSGHVQVVAAPTFFIAKVFSDYHPDSKIKWVFYGIASVATSYTAYLRLIGGQHFPSDILLGTATGVLAGILVPQYHKTKSTKKSSMSVMPYSTGDINGMVMTYKFK